MMELTEQGQHCLQALLRIWFEFERDLGVYPSHNLALTVYCKN